MVEEHGAEMSARDRRDARRVPAEFEFEEVSAGSGGRRGRRDRGDRERDREPPPHVASQPPGAGARPQAAGARRREAFGGNLTTEAPQAQAGGASQQASRRQTPSPDVDDEPRLSALVARLNGLAPHPTTAVPAVKAAVRSYRASESSARDLILTVWNILDRNLDGTASIVNSLVDLIDDEEKKHNLLAAWNGFKVEAAVSGNQSLKKILGESVPAQPAWKSGQSSRLTNGSGESGTSTPGEQSAQGEGETEGAQGQGTVGKKKGKGKQKQTLFTLGSFPT
ncbi:hypothetical protein BN946_scf184587.g2 [Trametes cinnabarina]|uniref:ZNF598/HEL2 PAH domain-containing protein n=1 Tax=Pycnoporus cinnabarinus TaxID=5643 RepID=A0A060SWR7_PYCCI|nr:hypothetical protein BN946_scf184587.g2 [Trametes cinnabarina]